MRRIRLPMVSLVVALAAGVPALAQVAVPLPRAPAPGQPAPAPPPPVSLPSTTVPLPEADSLPPEIVIPPAGINPYDRDIDITAPLVYRDRPLGEIPVLLTRDDRFVVETATFLKLIDTLLNKEAAARLNETLAGLAAFENKDLVGTGIELQYDPGTLSVVVLHIDANERPDFEDTNAYPARFSAYLNFNAVGSYFSGNSAVTGLRRPSLYFNGAARYGAFVLEGDFQLAEEFGQSTGYRFDRNYARLVYDQPADYRRWYLGDLQLETRGRQSYVRMGGLGVSRQRRRFDPFRPAILQGNRQLVLQHDATVDVLRNGTLLKQFQLQAGAYDLSSLPLTTGSNDVEVRVRDVTGASQTIAYRSYLDPIDLLPGDYEYGAYIGKTSLRFGRSPEYDGRVAFSGFFRKAFVDAPAIGIGLQASAVTQILTGQVQFVLGRGSRIGFDGGVSHTRGYGVGFAPGITFEQQIDRAGLLDSFTLHAEYTSRRFGNLSTDDPYNGSEITIDAQYARAINRALTLLLGGTFTRNRDNLGNTYRINAIASYRFSPKWSLRAGASYAEYGGGFASRDGFGFNLSLVFTPTYQDRAEALYEHDQRLAQLSYSHTSDGSIGSIGYGALVSRDDNQVSAQGYADYTASWFDASLSHSAFGDGFNSLTDQQVTSLRVGTSLAFAGGQFGVGRRINDSFAILYAHESLKGRAVVAGQSLAENMYLSRSGALGGAVNSYLSSYIPQSVQYDVENPPPGYDVGDGVFRVNPPYRSGYALQIGTDAFASATGTALGRDGKPLSLVGGRVIALDGKDARPVPFFTNSAGRFAIQNLRPGATYRVELYNAAGGFDITVPQDTTGLVDMKTITAGPAR
jgi:outer membrane usher protein